MARNKVKLDGVKVALPVLPVEAAGAVAVVLEPQEGGGLVVDPVAEEEVVLDQDVVGEPVGPQDAEGEFVVVDDGAVVPGVVLAVPLEPVVGVALTVEVGRSHPHAHVLQALVAVDASIDIPVLVPDARNSVVVVELNVVAGLDLGVERLALGQLEPELDLVGDGGVTLVVIDGGLHVDGAAGALGVDLGSDKLLVAEVVGDDREGLPGEVSPGLNLDGFGLRHQLNMIDSDHQK